MRGLSHSDSDGLEIVDGEAGSDGEAEELRDRIGDG